MSRINSFYLAPDLWQEPVILDGDEAHHLLRVLRAQPGHTIRLFDGQGRSGLFRVRSIGKKQASLECLSQKHSPAPPFPLILALGWAKHLRRSYLLEKAVELGVSQIWFWQATHSQGQLPAHTQEHWQRQLIPAAKQCGALWLPQVQTFAHVHDLCVAAHDIPLRLLCWEHEQTRSLSPDQLAHPEGCIVVLGPEGGLDSAEVTTCVDSGFRPTSLGPHILRHETAALFILSLHHWAVWSKAEEL